jgi:hypothetical protein
MKIKQMNKFKDRISPKESECITVSAFRHELIKIYDCLPSGGRVVISNIPAHLNGEGDLRIGVGGKYSLYLKPAQPGSFSLEEYVQWLEEAGFSRIALGPHPYSLSILVAEK